MKAFQSLLVLLAFCTAGCEALLGDKSDDETPGGPEGCTDGATSNDFPAGYSYSQCGTVFCGAFYESICVDGEWRTTIHDCLCRSPDAGVDAGWEEDGGAQPDGNGMTDAQDFDAPQP